MYLAIDLILMNKIIPIGIGVFVVLAIIAVYVLPHSGATSTTATTTASSQKGTTTILPTSTVAGTTTLPQGNSTDCISYNSTQSIYNGNFATSTYAGWNTTGNGFGDRPFNITNSTELTEYYGQPWTGYNGVYFATSYDGGTTVEQGNLTSNTFLVTEPYINFKVISPKDDELYVQILHNGQPAVTIHYNTYAVPLVNNTNSTTTFYSSTNFFNASIIVAPLLCDKVQIRIVAGLVGTRKNQFNYIAATDFYLSHAAIETPGIIVNQSFNFP